MKRNSKALRRTFSLTPEDIDAASDFVGGGLTELGLAQKDALRSRLSVEEVLLNWREAAGLDRAFTVELQRRWGRAELSVQCAGPPRDPLGGPPDEDYGAGALGRSALENLGLALSWQYRDGVNTVACAQKIRRRRSQLSQVLLAAALALALGGACQLLPGPGGRRRWTLCWSRCSPPSWASFPASWGP